MEAWLRLLRLPNLLTVPGDPVAGYLLAMACFESGAFCGVAGYSGGHIHNHLMMQAALCAAAGGAGLAVAGVLALCSQLFATLTRRFYSS